MKKVFDWEKFKISNLAVICETEEEANDFITECFKRNITWENNKFHTNYNKVYTNIGYTCCGKLGYSEECYYKNNKEYEVVYWKDYIPQLEKSIKAMLKDNIGLIVELGNGNRYMVMEDKLCGLDGWVSLSSYDDNLKHIYSSNTCDSEYWSVNKIYKTSAYCLNDKFKDEKLELIWSRKKIVKMTKAEIEAKLGYKIEIVETK